MKIASTITLFIASLFLVHLANAQLLGEYGFTGAAGTEETYPPNAQPIHGQLSSMKRGSGITPNSAANAFGAVAFTTNLSVDTADYFEFAVKCNSTFTLSLDSVVVAERRSNQGITSFAVRSSLDGFTSDLATFTVPDNNVYRNNQNVALGSAFKLLSAGTTVRFRYYGYGAEAETGSWRLDSVRVYGLISPFGTQLPTISFQNTSANITEGDSTKFIINATEFTSEIFSIVKKSGVINGLDISTHGTITNTQFPPGSFVFSRVVEALNDGVTEGTETAQYAIRTSSVAHTIGADSIFTLTINDAPVAAGPPFTRTIAQVRGANANGGADSVGSNVRLYGTVYGVNQRLTGGGYQMFLRDATGGIGIFKTTNLANVPTLTEGDSIKIMGKIEVFRGLSQINPDSITILATGRTLKAPTSTIVLTETQEGDLMRLNGVSLVSAAAWTGTGTGFTVQVTDNTNSFDVRIDNDCPLYSQPAPTGTFDIIGMGGQFANTTAAPFVGGYQLIPRKISDLVTSTATTKPKMNFATASTSFVEFNGEKFCTVTASSAPSVQCQPAIFIKGGNASANVDFTGFSSVSSIIGPATPLSINLPVSFLDDAVAEGTETLVVVLRKLGLPSDTAYEIGPDSVFTFTITDNDAPVISGPPFTRTIAQVRGANANGGADSVGSNVRLYGTVYGVNQRLTGGGYQMFLRDATGGIGIFKTTNLANVPTLTEGDSIKIMGKIEVFRGLSQINPDSITILATGRTLKAPTSTIVLTENQEGDLMRLNGVSLVSAAAWTGTGTGFTVQVTDGTNSFDVRIDNDCPLYSQPAPTGTFDIIGMGGQFANTTAAPFVGGYQLIPRKISDLVIAVAQKPTLRFTSTALTFTESAGDQVCPIAISSIPIVGVQVGMVVKGGTAAFGTDYQSQGAVTIFEPGSVNTNNLPVTFLDDQTSEPTENLILVLRKQGFPSDTAYEIGPDSVFTFTILDNDGTAPAGPPFTRTIAQIRGNNANGGADSVGSNVRLYGTVYGHNQRLTATGGGYQMFLRDATGGIGIFKTTPVNGLTTLNEGDSVKIMGKIEVFRGLSQINPDSVVVIATGRPLKQPEMVQKMNEFTEGDLVRLSGVQLVNPAAWTGTGTGFTVRVFKGLDTNDVRIDNDCPLYSQPSPTGTFDIIGMGGQFAASTTAPFTGGYQLLPRKTSDLITTVVSNAVFSFSPAAKTVGENSGAVSITVSTPQAHSENVVLNVAVKGGSATSGSDYQPLAINTLTFSSGTGTSQTFSLNVLDDATQEPAETVTLVIRQQTPTTDFSISSDSVFTLTISDNDGPVISGPPFTRTIAQVRGANTDGQADSVGRNVRLFGTVYGVNQRISNGAGYQMFIRDATGGIGIFKTTSLTNVPALVEGDSIKIMGKIEVFRGLSQINPDSMTILATGRTLKNPSVKTTLTETDEADLVRLNGVTLVSAAAWTGTGTGFTVQVTDGTNTTDVRIDNDCPLYSQPAPTGTFDIIGMVGQFAASTTAPFTGGYQLIPRKISDIVTGPAPTKPVVNFTVGSGSFVEADSLYKYSSIQSSMMPAVAIQPYIAIKGGTATNGVDYASQQGTQYSMGPGQPLTVPTLLELLDDALPEPTETITLVLRKAGLPADTNYIIGADSVFTFSILDNDSPVLPGVPFTRSIAQIRGANTDGQADSVGRNVRLFGTVYGVNQRISNGAGYQMFIRDATGGIGIFKTTSLTNVPALVEGDSIKIMGKIEVFRGLSQINPDSMVILATGRTLKAPTVMTAITEPMEADLLRFENATLVSAAAWTGTGTGFTVQVTNGSQTIDVRIDNDCPLYSLPAPTGTFHILGMGSQFASSTTAPFTGGYQLIPRTATDLIPVIAVNPLCNCEANLVAYPNPGSNHLVLETKSKTPFTYRIYNGLGQQMWEKKGPEATEIVETSQWPAGIYTIRVAETGRVLKWVKK